MRVAFPSHPVAVVATNDRFYPGVTDYFWPVTQTKAAFLSIAGVAGATCAYRLKPQ